MITAEELLALREQVIWLGLVIGIAFGAISQATRFCTLGAIADWVVVGNRLRMQAWWMAMAAAVLATQTLLITGLLDNAASFYTAPRLIWASNLIGGLIFGAGMVLASGCGVRTLIRIGEGSLKALVVFLVMSLTALMTIRVLTAIWRSQTVEKFYVD
ncbi:MAG: YeeE/YedE thiosulfate transporter family protein, partial [Burkholderiaceae bacterium]